MRTRKRLRAPHLNYRNGTFLVTVNAHLGRHIFGAVRDGVMVPNDLGNLVLDAWKRTTGQGDGARNLQFQLMPNHLHGIVLLENALRDLGTVVRSCKTRVTREARRYGLWPSGSALWHRSFHDSFIRSERRMHAALAYVRNNPREWSLRRGQ